MFLQVRCECLDPYAPPTDAGDHQRPPKLHFWLCMWGWETVDGFHVTAWVVWVQCVHQHSFFIQAHYTLLGPIVPWFSSFLIDFLKRSFSSPCPYFGNSTWLPSEVPGKRRSCGHGISEGEIKFGKLLILWPGPVNYQWSDVWEPQAADEIILNLIC